MPETYVAVYVCGSCGEFKIPIDTSKAKSTAPDSGCPGEPLHGSASGSALWATHMGKGDIMHDCQALTNKAAAAAVIYPVRGLGMWSRARFERIEEQ